MKRQLIETLGRRQRGQTLILFTLLFTILIGFLALAIDLGFLFGQRRWNQDGADAAAMAAGRTIAGSISPDSNNNPFISTTDCVLYTKVRQYAGLSAISSSSCGSPLSSTPTGENQNAGLDSSNKVAVVMEYWTGADGATWCFSPASISALPTGTLASGTYPRSGEGLCTLETGVDGDFPPAPGSSAYKVRVTVSSVTTSSFAQMIVQNGNIGPALQPTNQNQAACVRPGGANGMLTCSQAVVSVSSVESAESGAVIPFTAHDCNLTDSTKTGQLYSLWTNNSPPACPDHSENLGGAWKSVLDFSWEQGWSLHDNRFTGWCPLYGYQDAMPDTNVPSGTYLQVYSAYYSPTASYPTPPGSGWTANCIVTAGPPSYPANATSSVHDWQRDGTNGYSPDTTYAGEDNITTDVQYWASQGFAGRIIPDNGWTDGTTTVPSGHGNFMPTYCNSGGCGGNQGNNIAAALYCTYNNGGGNTTGVTNSGNGCSISGNNQTTYFFALNQITDYCPLPGNTQADSNVRCRTALIPTWGDPQSYNSGSNNWQSTNNQPDRVKIMEMVPLRMYCEIPQSGSYCTDPPNSLANTPYLSGGVGNSSGWGMFVSEVGVCTSSCTGAVGFTVNAATLSQ